MEVPEGIACTVLAEYGNVTVTDLGKLVAAQATYGGVTAIYTTTQPQDDLELKSTYGAVDLTLPTRMGADVVLQTEYGDLYTDTDIDIQVGESTEKMFYHRTVGTIRGGREAGHLPRELRGRLPSAGGRVGRALPFSPLGPLPTTCYPLPTTQTTTPID